MGKTEIALADAKEKFPGDFDYEIDRDNEMAVLRYRIPENMRHLDEEALGDAIEVVADIDEYLSENHGVYGPTYVVDHQPIFWERDGDWLTWEAMLNPYDF